MADAHDPWALPPELEDYSGHYYYEDDLSDRDRYRLAVTRSQCSRKQSMVFGAAYAAMMTSPEYHDALRAAGDDPRARAAVKCQHEIDCYPFRIDWEDDELEGT